MLALGARGSDPVATKKWDNSGDFENPTIGFIVKPADDPDFSDLDQLPVMDPELAQRMLALAGNIADRFR